MTAKVNVAIMLPGSGTVVNLVTNEVLSSPGFTVALDPGELRAFRVGP
jgi:hypothetical protein